MNTTLVFLVFLAVPSFAKLVWKKPNKNLTEKLNKAKGQRYTHFKGLTVLELGTPEPTITGSNKMIVLFENPSQNGLPPSFFYMPIVTDAEENVQFDTFADLEFTLVLRIAKARAEIYANTLAFKCVWEYTRSYYALMEISPPHTPEPVDVNSVYRISDPTVIMTYKTEDDRLGAIHTTNSEYPYLFTVWLQDVDGYYRLIHTSETMHLHNIKLAILKYLQVPVQWAEPWQEVGKDPQVFSADDSAKLVSQLEKKFKTGINGITLQKTKRVRKDPMKIAVFCRDTSGSIVILAIVTAPTEGGRAFDLNFIYKVSQENECMEKELQEYLSQQAFPLTNDWKRVTKSGNEVKDIEGRIKETLETMYKHVQICNAVYTRNVGSAYREKAAIVYTKANEPENKIYGKYIYVAWTESDGNCSIKSIGERVCSIEKAKNQFNFYGKLPFAYTELKFEKGVGWYSKEQVPEFIMNAMPLIKQDLQELKSNIQSGYKFDAEDYLLQDAGHISAKTSEEEGGLYFRLKVTRKEHVQVETVDVMFIHERYIRTEETPMS